MILPNIDLEYNVLISLLFLTPEEVEMLIRTNLRRYYSL